MSDIVIYTTSICPFCLRAKRLLDSKGAKYREVNVEHDDAERDRMMQAAGGRRTVPQIFVDGKHLGDCSEIVAMNDRGELEARLGLK